MVNEIYNLVWLVPTGGKWTIKKKFYGTWRITEIQGYDKAYLDLSGPASIKISSRGTGRFNFGAVEAEIDGKMDDLDERILRFSFEGEDEGDQFIGRGYCLVEDGVMVGRIFHHYGDHFGFKAIIEKPKTIPKIAQKLKTTETNQGE